MRKSYFRLSNFKVENIIELENNIIPKGISSSSFLRLWKEGLTGKDIIVAVIDSGIDASHPDLRNKVIKSFNLSGENGPQTHATHVAGTIAANGKLLGGAYDCKLIDIKVIGSNGGSISNVIKGIYLAVNNGARVINMSLGGDVTNEELNALTASINFAWDKGCVCVCAAGNDGTSVHTPDKYSYPASVDRAESIAACEIDENLNVSGLASFSNENDKVDLSACGRYVLSTYLNGKYGILSGTSMATPHVTAMLAALAEKIKTLAGSNFSTTLVNMLNENIQSIGNYNISFGRGFLKYKPNLSPIWPTGDKMYDNGIFIGHQ